MLAAVKRFIGTACAVPSGTMLFPGVYTGVLSRRNQRRLGTAAGQDPEHAVSQWNLMASGVTIFEDDFTEMFFNAAEQFLPSKGDPGAPPQLTMLVPEAARVRMSDNPGRQRYAGLLPGANGSVASASGTDHGGSHRLVPREVVTRSRAQGGESSYQRGESSDLTAGLSLRSAAPRETSSLICDSMSYICSLRTD